MTCAAIETGNRFLGAMLAHVDCQAQSIGAYGYGALADPASPVAALLLMALTLFVALFGLRLMFGETPGGRDVVGAVLKIGIALTIATSWPAWRTLAHQVVLDGPAQIAGSIGAASGLPSGPNDLFERLDRADQAIVTLTAYGSGRLTGGIAASAELGDSTRGIALADQEGLAWGRVFFLVGTIGPIALVRLSTGILLAFAPLLAGLLLFAGTRDVFLGWLRALGACALAGVALALVLGAELAVLEGWLGDALRQREANVLTPAAPTELLVIALAFAVVGAAVLGLVARVVFFATPGLHWLRITASDQATAGIPPLASRLAGTSERAPETARAHQIADAVSHTIRREERLQGYALAGGAALAPRDAPAPSGLGGSVAAPDALGSSYRRGYRRRSALASSRDARP